MLLINITEDNPMITLINVIILTLILYTFSVQISTYNSLVFEKHRFRYFAIRDRLALLVVYGKIEEQSWEYQRIIDAVNFHIKTIENMSINNIIRLLVRYHNSPDESNVVNMIHKKIDNEEVIKIMVEFFDITSAILKRNSWMQLKAVKIILSMRKRPNILDDPEILNMPEVESIRNSKSALENIKTFRDSLNENLLRLKAA